MIKVKPGVTFVYHPAGFRILEAAKHVSAALGFDLTITSGSDGVHSGPTDPHYTGKAYDFRLKTLAPEERLAVVAGFTAELGKAFFVFHEAAGTSNEHLHVQPVKGTTYTMEQYLTT